MSADDARFAVTFGERVRASRKRLRTETGRGVTQGQLATMVGVDRNTVSRWENGGMLPKDPAVIAALARVLRVSVDWLVGELVPKTVPKAGGALAESLVYPIDGRAESLPSRAAALVVKYLDRVSATGCPAHIVQATERVLVNGAKHGISNVPFEAREMEVILADIDAMWDFVVAVFRRDGVRL